MQRYTIFFIIAHALHVSGGFSATASVGEFDSPALAVAASNLDIYLMLCVQCIPYSHPHRITSTKGRINTAVFPDDGHLKVLAVCKSASNVST